MDHKDYLDWIDREAEGQLSGADRAELDAHLSGCEPCRRERALLVDMHQTLRQGAAAVRPDFRAAVVSSLPAAGWESRSPRTWAFPLALLLALGGGAAALVGRSAAHLEPTGAFFGALRALFDVFATALVAGAGLLGASWRGVGMALADVLGRSALSWTAAAAGVLGLNLILIRLLRRPGAGESAPAWGIRLRRLRGR